MVNGSLYYFTTEWRHFVLHEFRYASWSMQVEVCKFFFAANINWKRPNSSHIRYTTFIWPHIEDSGQIDSNKKHRWYIGKSGEPGWSKKCVVWAWFSVWFSVAVFILIGIIYSDFANFWINMLCITLNFPFQCHSRSNIKLQFYYKYMTSYQYQIVTTCRVPH